MRIKTILVAFLVGATIILSGCANKASIESVSSENVAIFEISEERCTLEGPDKLVITGVVTNRCDVPVSKVIIRYDIYGNDGNRTRDWGVESANEWELFYVSLNPGESMEFHVSGEISERTNGVASFEFNNLRCIFDEPNDYKEKEVTGYVSREESELLVDAAIE